MITFSEKRVQLIIWIFCGPGQSIADAIIMHIFQTVKQDFDIKEVSYYRDTVRSQWLRHFTSRRQIVLAASSVPCAGKH